MRTAEAIVELMKEVTHYIFSVLIDTFEGVKRKLPLLLDIFNPLICMILVVGMYYERGSLQFGGEWFVPFALVVFKWFLQIANDMQYRDVYGFPVARKRFTKKRSNGTVEFKSNEIVEIVEYLAEVEDYCSKRGLYDKK